MSQNMKIHTKYGLECLKDLISDQDFKMLQPNYRLSSSDDIHITFQRYITFISTKSGKKRYVKREDSLQSHHGAILYIFGLRYKYSNKDWKVFQLNAINFLTAISLENQAENINDFTYSRWINILNAINNLDIQKLIKEQSEHSYPRHIKRLRKNILLTQNNKNKTKKSLKTKTIKRSSK